MAPILLPRPAPRISKALLDRIIAAGRYDLIHVGIGWVAALRLADVPKGEDSHCRICGNQFSDIVDAGNSETAILLNCGHLAGSKCLERVLHDQIPRCRDCGIPITGIPREYFR